MSVVIPTALLLVKATLVLLLALFVCKLMKRASAASRHYVWAATLGALLLLPLMMPNTHTCH